MKSQILTIFQYCNLPILHSSNLALCKSCTLPILHSSNLTLFQLYTLPILHTSNITLFQYYNLKKCDNNQQPTNQLTNNVCMFIIKLLFRWIRKREKISFLKQNVKLNDIENLQSPSCKDCWMRNIESWKEWLDSYWIVWTVIQLK